MKYPPVKFPAICNYVVINVFSCIYENVTTGKKDISAAFAAYASVIRIDMSPICMCCPEYQKKWQKYKKKVSRDGNKQV